MKKKNILFISSQFPNPVEPTLGVFSLQLVKEMRRLADITVISPVASLHAFNFLNSFKKHKIQANVPFEGEIENVPAYYPSYTAVPKMGFLHPQFVYRAVLPLIERVHGERRIEAVNCHWIFPDGVAVQKICERLGIPLMLTPLGTDLNYYPGYRFRRGSIVKALTRADRVSVLNSAMLEKCLEFGVARDRLAVIPNGVDQDRFRIMDAPSCRKKLGIPVDAKVILFVGSLVPVKGVESLLKAFAILSKTRRARPLKLYLVGAGHLEESLKALSVALRVDKDTVFAGSARHSEIPEWMSAADCFCLPSLNEGHPNVMMEALASGVPVVASSVGSIPDFITPANGFVTVPEDEKDLARKLEACLANTYAKDKVRSTVEKYSWGACAKAYVSELERLIRR